MNNHTKIVANRSLSSQNPQVNALKKYIFKDDIVAKKVEEDISNSPVKKDFFVVFLSICNKKNRALVVKASGRTLNLAWKNAEQKAARLAAKKDYDIVWAKADIVNYAEEILTVDLNKTMVENHYQYFFRKGIALDDKFDIAFLEAEINGNKLLKYYTKEEVADKKIDYDSIRIDLTNINNYRRKYYDRANIRIIPKNLTIFTTLGFFCGEDGNVYELYNKGYDTGRRIIDTVDDNVAETIIVNASKYLYRMIKPNGEFIYGFFPIFNNPTKSYNILRHSGAIWSLINLYRITNDAELIPKLDCAIDYLIKGYIKYKTDDVAYTLEKKSNEIKLGGNAINIIMLTEYMDVFKTDKYINLVCHLANGILELEDSENGTFYHVLNYPDYSKKAEYRTVFYDGESTFALTRAYTFTKDERYLNGAKAAVENFIKKDYTKFKDHWVAYSLNEITKYIPDKRYYKFALQNVAKNLNKLYKQETSSHIYMELLTATWQTYMRIKDNNIELEYLKKFDVEYFAQAIYRRARHMLNAYFYPEYAMYMKNPDIILNAFFVRHENYRVRIDDIQHFIGGYYLYTKHYNEILPYLSEKFLSEINTNQ